MGTKKVRENVFGGKMEFNAEHHYFEESTLNLGDANEFDPKKAYIEITYITKNYHHPIEDVIHYLLEMQKAGATHIDFKAICDYEGSSETVEMQAFKEREESPEEHIKRTLIETQNSLISKCKKDKEEFEKYQALKAKFEGK